MRTFVHSAARAVLVDPYGPLRICRLAKQHAELPKEPLDVEVGSWCCTRIRRRKGL